MRVKYRLYGAYGFLAVLTVSFVILISQPNATEMWVAIVFLGAFGLGMAVYIKSNRTEKVRLQKEKEKKKGKTSQHEGKKK